LNPQPLPPRWRWMPTWLSRFFIRRR
jgi:hypothetical protein